VPYKINTTDSINNRLLSDRGRNDFQVSAIKWSYRMRGIVARTQMNSRANAVVLIIIIMSLNMVMFSPKNSTEVNSLITKIFVYSAIKIKANRPLLNSTLKPDTSSDSPSAKSNGVRFVSAKLVINHIAASGSIMRPTHDICVIAMLEKSSDFNSTSTLSRSNLILTSYEMVCATPRRAPNRAYLELEHQPARNVEYTFILDTHKKYSTPNIIKYAG